MYSKILVPVDGSAPSNQALLEAIKVAKATSGKLRLVHVVDEFVMGGVDNPGFYNQAVVDALSAVGRRILQDAESLVRQHALEPGSTLLETFGHRVADLVVNEAQSWGADLIVIGTHGRRGIRRLVMGSDAELILRTAAVPVLLVRGEPERT